MTPPSLSNYNVKKLNEIIPLSKHNEYCSDVFDKINIPYEAGHPLDYYMNDFTEAFWSIEQNGVKVSDDVCDIFDMRVKKHISNGKLYSQYNLWTTTGRPSNSFGSVNFAALPPEKRKSIVAENDYLVEMDYDAYHLRLIAEIVGYEFPEGSVHQYLADQYGVDYDKSKSLSFKYLYGEIPYMIAKKIPFFSEVQKYIDKKWLEYKRNNFVVSDIYNRKIGKNVRFTNKSKLF